MRMDWASRSRPLSNCPFFTPNISLVLNKATMVSPQAHEQHPDPQTLTSTSTLAANYLPSPSNSFQLSPSRQKIVEAICRLYSGSASEEDMQVYGKKAVYDDPWSYCDNEV